MDEAESYGSARQESVSDETHQRHGAEAGAAPSVLKWGRRLQAIAVLQTMTGIVLCINPLWFASLTGFVGGGLGVYAVTKERRDLIVTYEILTILELVKNAGLLSHLLDGPRTAIFTIGIVTAFVECCLLCPLGAFSAIRYLRSLTTEDRLLKSMA